MNMIKERGAKIWSWRAGQEMGPGRRIVSFCGNDRMGEDGMRGPKTFGECLGEMMRGKHISVADLTRRVNYRSKTSISRLLRDEVRYASIEDFMGRLEPIAAWLFSEDEMRLLRDSMEVSRLGRQRYRAYQDIWRLVGQPEEKIIPVTAQGFGNARNGELDELIGFWNTAHRLEMILINSGFESLFSRLARLLRERPSADISIRHYLAIQDSPGLLAEQLGAMMNVFHDPRYQGYYHARPDAGGEWNRGDTVHIMLVRGEDAEGEYTQMIVMMSENECAVYESREMEDIMPFVRQVMGRVCREALPLKTRYPEQALLDGLIVISRRYLGCELDRTICCLAPDICFELIPMEILYDVMFDSVLKGSDPEDAKIRELMRIHEARYRNIHEKRRKTQFIFSYDSLRRFAETGRTTDHVAGMRAFLPEERAAILRDVVRKCRENVYLGVRILRPDVRVRGMTLTTYEALGVYLLDAYTQYDVVNGHSEAFMLTPDFAETMEEFFRDELIAKHTFSEGESLEIMEELARRCGATGKAE